MHAPYTLFIEVLLKLAFPTQQKLLYICSIQYHAYMDVVAIVLLLRPCRQTTELRHTSGQTSDDVPLVRIFYILYPKEFLLSREDLLQKSLVYRRKACI